MTDARPIRPSKSGMGLLGMRERVAALARPVELRGRPSGGSALRVVIPLAAANPQALERAA